MAEYINSLFRIDLPTLSNSARYFLIRTWVIAGRGVCCANLKELVGRMGMSKESVLACRDELMAARPGSRYGAGYLLEVRVPSRSQTLRGRPRKGFRIASDFLNEIDLDVMRRIGEGQVGINDGAVAALLMAEPVRVVGVRGDGDVATKIGQLGKKYELTVSSRLLLARLWCMANGAGMVYATPADISRQSGMTRPQVIRHLDKLQNLGAFRERVPAKWGKGMLPVSPEILFLNPLWPTGTSWPGIHWERYLLGADGALGEMMAVFNEVKNISDLDEKILLLEEQGEQQRLNRSQERWLERLKREVRDKKTEMAWLEDSELRLGQQETAEDAGGVEAAYQERHPVFYTLFKGSVNEVRKYVVGVTCQYAANVISNYADEILSRKKVKREAVLAAIQKDLFNSKEWKSQQDKIMAQWICSNAIRLAGEVLKGRELILMRAEAEKCKREAGQDEPLPNTQEEDAIESAGEMDRPDKDGEPAELYPEAKKLLGNGEHFSLYVHNSVILNVLVRIPNGRS